MQTFYNEIPLVDGFEVLEHRVRHDRLVHGRQVNRPGGWHLFTSMEQQGERIRCWCCNVEADRWVVEKGPNDKLGHPDLNLYALSPLGIVLMTRDHIIPKSLGGVDGVENLRPMCSTCNSIRGNFVTDADLEFARTHPELIDPKRTKSGIEIMKRHVAQIPRHRVDDVIAAIKPFILIGHI
jgi:5-methylcytosine-specific restriction endonuclease McrA